MLEEEIVPCLLELHPLSEQQQTLMLSNPDYPCFTLVFDREANRPVFIGLLI
jgi:hypothetical protein